MRAVPCLLRQLRSPARDLQHVEVADRSLAERRRRLAQVVPEPVLARRRAGVLLKERLRQLGERRIRTVQRPEPRLAELVVEDRLRLHLRSEPATLAPAAARVAPDQLSRMSDYRVRLLDAVDSRSPHVRAHDVAQLLQQPR
jgi:hypothetical protein